MSRDAAGLGVSRLPRLTNTVVLVVIGSISLGLHVLAVALGVRVTWQDLTTKALAKNDWQLLPANLLRHDLVSSIAHLQSQPPLFNIATGVLLQLPHVMQPSAATGMLVACGVAVAVSTAGMLLEFSVRRPLVLAIVLVLVVADPAEYLYGAVYFYALPTAALVTAAAWAATRWVRTERALPGVAYGVLAALLILTNSSYQVYTVAIATIPVLWVLRHRWRQAVAVLVVPAALVAAWYGNDLVQFHSETTSGWVGMNLARATLGLDSPADINALIAQGVLSGTARVPPFSGLGGYGALGHHAPTGVAALDVRSTDGYPNYNNIAYVAISKQYLSDDLRWIEHRPLHYVKNVTVGLRLWLLPTEQWYGTDSGALASKYHLGGYTTVYDAVVDLQPTADPGAVLAVIYHHEGPGFADLSVTTVVVTLLAIVILPIAAWRRRRTDAKRAAASLWLWAIVTSVFVTTTLLEAAENNRFRFELGGVPLVAATLAVAFVCDPSGAGGRLLYRRAGREGGGAPREALAVDDEAPGVPARGSEG